MTELKFEGVRSVIAVLYPINPACMRNRTTGLTST
jgi:hypothetical protein